MNNYQLTRLTQFVTKHKIQEIKLNQAESRFFFDFLDQGKSFTSSRLLFQPAFAEGVIHSKNEDTKIIIIPKNRLLRSKKIQWEDGFDNFNVHTNPFTKRLLEIFIAKMGYEILFDKIANEMKLRHPLSQGQAKAIILKHLGFRLSSGTRSFLHDLRNKIRKYQALIVNFQEYVILPQDDIKLTPETFAEELKSKFASGEIHDFLKPATPTVRISGKDVLMKEFYEKHKEIVKNKDMPKIEKSFFLQDQAEFEYYCLSCGSVKPMNKEQLQEDSLVQTPQHCDTSMVVRLVPD